MSRKIDKASAEEQLRILNQLDEEKNPRLIGIDDYDRYLNEIYNFIYIYSKINSCCICLMKSISYFNYKSIYLLNV